jgi:predicted GNAT superfamily acetyltransferase
VSTMPTRTRNICIRHCDGFDELGACVDLQTEVWGYNDGDVIPRRAFVVAQKIGGQVLGAFEDERNDGTAPKLVGFAMSLPGVRDGVPYLHSHMLAVRAAHQNEGIGRALKLAQREDALKRGIRRMEWTFDPLVIKNAFLNISKLGAVVRSYTHNFYGVSSSRLQAGLPTDRLHAEWWMDSERVESVLEGTPFVPSGIQETILVPAAVSEWRDLPQQQTRALAVQVENRQKFQHAFGRGLAIVGFEIDLNGNGLFQLSPWQEQLTRMPRKSETQ